ncbi:putative dual-specificity RNA methyltransferase RlmN [Variovorax paradoxus]|uniref:Putative dual-specificity RNA methyltransferase RlmN n=1 Tax=Variovorax paradoxus TaxID=34073 RepID=A0A679J7A7_VARPD|nr:putative dual-specificity RNA methyltransferase RlmN [Variovorax paradoxus]
MLRIHELKSRLREAGAGPGHEQRILRLWSHALPRNSGRRLPHSFFPASLMDALPAIEAELAGLARIHAVHPGADGSERLLVALADGQTVESVLLPRDGLCVSSQVGCAVGCQFCMTGREGLLRQVGSAEIIAQVALARTRRPVRKVVFMGMGEPAHNLDNVLEAIDLLGTVGNVGHKNLVFSTVGDPRVFDRLLQERVKPALALSLHTTRAELRRTLLPRAPGMTPEEVVAAGERYARATGYPIQYQWTLLEGVNDGPDEIDGLVRLLGGKYGVLNMIPFNAVDGVAFSRPSWERCREIARVLHERGILTKLRNSAGQDVDGGCGQLRARAAEVQVRADVKPVGFVRRLAGNTP